jgi:predicted acetylornithine/succinylornithine family transaminase
MSALLGVYDRTLVLASGRGAELKDQEGTAYLDFAAGIGVNGLGHCDRQVVRAIRRQAGELIHASNLYRSSVVEALAERLVSLAFPSKVFFCNSGTEAVEAAIKFARRIGGKDRRELVAFEGSFHGRTMGALSITWTAKYREPFEPLIPGVRFARFNDLASAREVVSDRTAAVIVEPVQGEGGVRPATGEFLSGLGALCRERGALLVADEVQCGLGRTGKMFGYLHSGVGPDILTLAKPLGGGLPLGAVLLREELAGSIAVGDHGSTFGGNPVAAAAALVVLDRLSAPGFVDGVARRGRKLLSGLRRLQRAYPTIVAEVRGLGLMAGLEVRGRAADVQKGLEERKILATRAGDHVVRLLPPLIVAPRQIAAVLSALEEILGGGAGAPA